MGSRRTLSRRSLLLGSAAATLGAAGLTLGTGCAPARQPASVERLLAEEPFYIAHRGGWLDWPEMTAFAYSQSLGLPHVLAVEISVCVTSDGILVCSHDPTTTRVTGAAYEIGAVPWDTLAPLTVTSEFTRDPGQPRRPLARLDDVLDWCLDTVVVFIEPKTAAAVEPLKRRLEGAAQPTRTVWKQPVNQPHFAWAKQQGFATWGYVLDEPSHSGDRLRALAADPAIDMLGVQDTRTDEAVTEVVRLGAAAGKRTIMWSIGTASQRTRALRLGCRGLMTAEISDLPRLPLG
jgi:glycerophosphoryl diester phosphodiesterase